MNIKTLITIAAALAFTFVSTGQASAQEFVYRPLNPAFGGNPGNYSWMLQSANAQNLYQAQAQDRFARDPLADFQQSLQRQVLSELTRQIVRIEFGEGELQDRRFEFGEFSIEIFPGPDGVEIVIINILTGDQTSVNIPNF
jgi:curli production assembly/transport component CsgF